MVSKKGTEEVSISNLIWLEGTDVGDDEEHHQSDEHWNEDDNQRS